MIPLNEKNVMILRSKKSPMIQSKEKLIMKKTRKKNKTEFSKNQKLFGGTEYIPLTKQDVTMCLECLMRCHMLENAA